MIIAFPVSVDKIKVEVSQSFGRAYYFLFFNTETEENIYIKNEASNSQGGAGIKAANIKIYKTINETVLDNIHALNEGKLKLLDDIHAGYHNHGGN